MTRPPWREASPDAVGERPEERAPAYAAPDGSFVLWNDLEEGVSVLVRGPVGPERAGVVAPWMRSAPGPHPLATPDAVDGYGVFTFPYGPVSMGVPDAGRFDLRTYGERILEATPVGGFKSRRVLSSIVGQRPEDAALRIERIAGPFSAAHAAAFLAAVESARGQPVPISELRVRAVAQELQRLHNHARQIARVAEAASQNVGHAQMAALAEEMLRLSARLFGHRWLFGALLPSGPPRRLDPADRKEAGERLRRFARAFDELWTLFLGSRTFLDRIQTTGTVRRADAVRYGAVGPTLRAAGVPWDDRLRAPTPPYDDLFLSLPQETEGDGLARLLVRAGEVHSSLLLLEQLFDRWDQWRTEEVAPAPAVADGRGLARTEAPSGDLVYDVRLDGGRLGSVGLRSPSHANWPLLALGLRNAAFTDFHFAFETFGLSFAETDG